MECSQNNTLITLSVPPTPYAYQLHFIPLSVFVTSIKEQSHHMWHYIDMYLYFNTSKLN